MIHTLPLVTVLIPCLNAEDFIIDSLESIFNQTYKNLEIILVDDGSKNQLSDFLPKRLMSKIKIIRNSNNLGICESLNIGLKIAKGEFIARMDSDDWSHAERIEKQIKAFAGQPNYLAGIGTQLKLVNSNKIYRYPTLTKNIEFAASFANPIPHATLMIKADIYKKFRYIDYKGVKGMEDYYLWTRMMKKGYKFQIINEPLYFYRQHSTQTTKKGDPRKTFALLDLAFLNQQNQPSGSNQIKMINSNSYLALFFMIIKSIDNIDRLSVLSMYSNWLLSQPSNKKYNYKRICAVIFIRIYTKIGQLSNSLFEKINH